MTRGRILIAGAVAVVLVVGALAAVWLLGGDDDYGADKVAPTASLQVVEPDGLQAALDKAGAADRDLALGARAGDQLVVGQVRWRTPPSDSGRYEVLLIDKRVDRRPPAMSVSSAGTGSVSVGSSPRLDAIAARYDWLKGAGQVAIDGQLVAGGVSISAAPNAATPLTFVALFPAELPASSGAARGPISLDDLLVALVYVGPGDTVRWAERLHG